MNLFEKREGGGGEGGIRRQGEEFILKEREGGGEKGRERGKR